MSNILIWRTTPETNYSLLRFGGRDQIGINIIVIPHSSCARIESQTNKSANEKVADIPAWEVGTQVGFVGVIPWSFNSNYMTSFGAFQRDGARSSALGLSIDSNCRAGRCWAKRNGLGRAVDDGRTGSKQTGHNSSNNSYKSFITSK